MASEGHISGYSFLLLKTDFFFPKRSKRLNKNGRHFHHSKVYYKTAYQAS